MNEDLARVRDLAADLPAPVATATDQREIDRLSPRQRGLLTAVLNGKTAYGGTERWTVEALQRRQLLTVTIYDNDRFAAPQLHLTGHDAELAALALIAKRRASYS